MNDRLLTPQEMALFWPDYGKNFLHRHVDPLLGLLSAGLAEDWDGYRGWVVPAERIAELEPDEALMHALQIATIIAERLLPIHSIEHITEWAVYKVTSPGRQPTQGELDAVAAVFTTLLRGGEDPCVVADTALEIAYSTLGEDVFTWGGAPRRALFTMQATMWLCLCENRWSPSELLLATLDAVYDKTRM